tara:strand:+ start:23879 stop:24394 length:516 start_codon:yes stop_codon:yes gene_type:complete
MKPALNKKYLHITLILALNLLILSGCNQNSDQREFEQQAFSEPSGITETDQQGNVVEGNIDPDDWRIAPFFQGDIELLLPPFPNPVLSNGELKIEIQVNFLERISGIYIRVFRFSSFYQIDDRPQVPTGLTSFRIDANIIAGEISNPQGIYRIIIQDENENVITYGDVEIE